MKINEIWNELETDTASSGSLIIRRYASSVLPNIFVALRQPERIRCIAFRFSSQHRINLSRYSNLKDIGLALMPDPNDFNKQYLLILLSSKQHKDVFSTLCEDLMFGISNVTEEDRLLKELLNRFEKWISLFDKAGLQGLSPEEQRGLFGELYFLRKWISHATDLQKCIQSWLGPEKQLRDFQLESWALEVKTTQGNNHQKVRVSSERQLDTSNLNYLFLFHLSLESQQQHGEILNRLVDSVIELLNSDIAAQSQFKSKILQSGYFSHHRPLYEATGYHIRQESFYRVRDAFPRIEENDIRRGVGDVKYSVILSEYADYLITESSIFEIIN